MCGHLFIAPRHDSRDDNDAIHLSVDLEAKSLTQYKGGEVDAKIQQARTVLKDEKLVMLDSPIMITRPHLPLRSLSLLTRKSKLIAPS